MKILVAKPDVPKDRDVVLFRQAVAKIPNLGSEWVSWKFVDTALSERLKEFALVVFLNTDFQVTMRFAAQHFPSLPFVVLTHEVWRTQWAKDEPNVNYVFLSGNDDGADEQEIWKALKSVLKIA